MSAVRTTSSVSASCSVCGPKSVTTTEQEAEGLAADEVGCRSCFPLDLFFKPTEVSFLLLVLVALQGGPLDEEALTRHNAGRKTEPGTNEKSRDGDGTKDYYEECLDMSAALERRPNQHNWFKANSMYNVSADEPGDHPALT